MAATGIPPLAAHSIDRLARRAHRFHRFAHHPLCQEYAGEVFRLPWWGERALERRLYLCRGCCLGGTGIVLGLAVGLLLAPDPRWAAGGAAVGVLALVLLRSKWGQRLLPALGLNVAIGAGLRQTGLARLGLVLLPLLVAGVAYVLYRRRGPDRTACSRCPERGGNEVCRGFLPMVRGEETFRHEAQELIDSSSR